MLHCFLLSIDVTSSFAREQIHCSELADDRDECTIQSFLNATKEYVKLVQLHSKNTSQRQIRQIRYVHFLEHRWIFPRIRGFGKKIFLLMNQSSSAFFVVVGGGVCFVF